MNFKTYLQSQNACSDARAFVGDKTFKQAWGTAKRPDWMIWLMLRLGYEDDQMYRLFGCWCAANTPLGDGRVTWDLLTDNRSRKAILVAIDFANGEATREELNTARAAAMDAAIAAATAATYPYAAIAAAYAATYPYAAAGAAAYTAANAANAARDAYTAANAANAANAARDAAWDAAWTTQARELRRRVDFKKLERLVNQASRRLKGGSQ